MNFKNELRVATLIRRYKRFLADVEIDGEGVVTVYCPNTGSMRSCSTPGSMVCISRSDNPSRKYPFTLEMIQVGNTWVGVNTTLTNRIVAEALENGEITEFCDFDSIHREVKVSQRSRLDLMLMRGEGKIYIEVKNCSMVEQGVALFPDAVTARGTRHLLELEKLVCQGHEGVIFYLVQRSDASSFRPAAAIDQRYADTLAEVHQKGVKILVYQAEVRPDSIHILRHLPCIL